MSNYPKIGMRTEYVSLVEILRRVDFGIYDKEGADYRACQNFEPIYK